jgi:hypothetical protein
LDFGSLGLDLNLIKRAIPNPNLSRKLTPRQSSKWFVEASHFWKKLFILKIKSFVPSIKILPMPKRLQHRGVMNSKYDVVSIVEN